MNNSLVKSPEALEAMRQAGRIFARTMARLRGALAIGTTPVKLDHVARASILAAGAEPAFLGYQGYQDVLCVSVNDVVVHGVPDERPFESGDIVSIDLGVRYHGWNVDGAETQIVGEAPDEGRRLVAATEAALAAGISQIKDGMRLGDVQAAIQAVAEREGLGNITTLTGHGIGQALHEPPSIPNAGRRGTGPILAAGMTLCIEPMFTLGTDEVVTEPDGWSIRTKDGSLSAHAEHTVLVTKAGAEILTAPPDRTPVDTHE